MEGKEGRKGGREEGRKGGAPLSVHFAQPQFATLLQWILRLVAVCTEVSGALWVAQRAPPPTLPAAKFPANKALRKPARVFLTAGVAWFPVRIRSIVLLATHAASTSRDAATSTTTAATLASSGAPRRAHTSFGEPLYRGLPKYKGTPIYIYIYVCMPKPS